MNAGRMRRGLLVPAVAALAGLVVLLGLGTWQLERKTWKEALIGTLDRRLNDAPIALPPPSEWTGMTPENSEFTRVRLHAEFANTGDALVYTSGSAIRDDVKGAGYFVFSPARLPSGQQVVVNRGFVPNRSYPAAAGAVDIVGALRWREAPSWFVSDHDAAGEIWMVRNPAAMAQQKGWGAVAPFYVEQEAPVPPGGLPHPAPLKVHLRNDHLQYAITWYGLAAVLVVMFAIWAARRQADATGGKPDNP
jgi:cytochrome oxidase assembly protein ShyY1